MRAVTVLLLILLGMFCFSGCSGEELDPATSGEDPAELGKADSSDQFFKGYFVSLDGEMVSDSFEVSQGASFTLKFFAPRNYGFEGGITAYLVDTYWDSIPYGTAYDVDCGTPGRYYIVREDTDAEVRADEPVCSVTTENLSSGTYLIRWQFYEYTYEGDWDWYSTRVLETGVSNTFNVVAR